VKIAFITSSLEPGRDGVGDYTRRLAGELIRQGHPSIVIGLNDPHVSKTLTGSQEVEGASVSVLRLPETMPWSERATIACNWLDAFSPDWVSLQFVPFGFHPKGLPFGLARHLKCIIGSRPLHWMFHELWVLWNFPLPLRKRLLGQCQKLCLRWCLRKLKPKAVATQLPVYQAELNKRGLAADVVPLHGNIPVCPNGAADKWLADRYASLTGPKQVKAGFFGNILSTLNPSLFAAQMAGLNVSGNELLLLSAGKIGGESARLWNLLEHEFKASATFLKLGELNEREASLYFSALDYGLTSYPPELMGKSGSVAAMREHGLKVISCGTPTRSSAGGRTDESWTVNQSALALLQQLQKATR
jgi:hypothetical protein